jgi:hypothetical protein
MQVMIEKTGDHSLVHWTNKHMETVFAYACHWGHVGTAKRVCVPCVSAGGDEPTAFRCRAGQVHARDWG